MTEKILSEIALTDVWTADMPLGDCRRMLVTIETLQATNTPFTLRYAETPPHGEHKRIELVIQTKRRNNREA